MIKVSELNCGQLFIYRHDDGSCCLCQFLGNDYGFSVVCGLSFKSQPRFIDSNKLVFLSIEDLEIYLKGDAYDEKK